MARKASKPCRCARQQCLSAGISGPQVKWMVPAAPRPLVILAPDAYSFCTAYCALHLGVLIPMVKPCISREAPFPLRLSLAHTAVCSSAVMLALHKKAKKEATQQLTSIQERFRCLYVCHPILHPCLVLEQLTLPVTGIGTPLNHLQTPHHSLSAPEVEDEGCML